MNNTTNQTKKVTTNIHHLTERTTYFLTIAGNIGENRRNIKTIMKELGDLITQHNTLYYTDQPIISDKQYDNLLGLLLSLEKKYPNDIHLDSPTQKLNISVQSGFQKKDHGGYRLLSLKNSYDAEDLYEWNNFLQRQVGEEPYTFILEPKFDGSSVHLVYAYGYFVSGITRGDGHIGEDITENMKAVQNLPLYLPSLQDIAEVRCRAEVMMPKTSFEKLNKQQQEVGGAVFANERNATAGTLRQLDPRVVKKRGLIVYVLDLIDRSYADEHMTNDIQRKELLRSWGFPFFDRDRSTEIYTTIEDIVNTCIDVSVKDDLYAANVLFDGLVIKINELHLRNRLGTTDHHPRRAMAFKYPALQTVTLLRDITYQIGRTGVLTPVAELEPVELSGANISRATLHNFDMIQSLDVRIGDAVRIQRSGEVIPYIIGPVIERRTGNETPVIIPTHCPSCNEVLVRYPGEVALVCPNTTGCLTQKKEQLKHAVSKSCMNITGLGDALVEQLVDAGHINDWSDIFSLANPECMRELRRLPGIADKKLQQLEKEINQAKYMELRRGLHALGIPYVGKKIARVLQTYLSDLIISDASTECTSIPITVLTKHLTDKTGLHDIFGLGPQTIDALARYFSNTYYLELLEKAYASGFSFVLPQKKDANMIKQGVLDGEVIVLTGLFPRSRDVISDILTTYGARVTTSVTAKTTLLIYGDRPGSKLEQAKKKEITSSTLKDLSDTYLLEEIQDMYKEQTTSSQVIGLF